MNFEEYRVLTPTHPYISADNQEGFAIEQFLAVSRQYFSLNSQYDGSTCSKNSDATGTMPV